MASILASHRPHCLPLFVIVCKKDFDSITSLCCDNPHSILGMHPIEFNGKLSLVVRAYVPDAINCEIIDIEVPQGSRFKLQKISLDSVKSKLLSLDSKRHNEKLFQNNKNDKIRKI